MKRILHFVFIVLITSGAFAQSGFDAKTKKNKAAPQLEHVFQEISGQQSGNTNLRKKAIQSGVELRSSIDYKTYRDSESGSVIFIENNKTGLSVRQQRKTATAQAYDFLEEVKGQLKVTNPKNEFSAISNNTDEQGLSHLKFQQEYNGVKIYGAEIVTHADDKKVKTLNGKVFPTPNNLSLKPKIDKKEAIILGLKELAKISIIQKDGFENGFFEIAQDQADLVIYHKEEIPVLAYEMTLKPNLLERWVVFMDAQTGEIIDKYNHTCTLDGVFQTSAKDLNGFTRSFNIIQSGSSYFMLDPSKPMFDNGQSKLPDAPVGAVWTIDALDSRISGEMEFAHVTSNDGTTWSPTAVSAHNNASICYDFYRTKFDRNSLNGKGGNIISVINITDEDGKGMDNAYWNGEFMGYGNGAQGFKPLAGALDVAGHEMTHGVIENTARLEYRNQSGALNESFADIFGALIDRDDWTLGEDVVKSNVFPSGALRSLENPNQGGQNDPGYQPKNMSQYVYLRDTPSEDNGGVHINSGIPNHAFYLFATANGMNKDKAEKVYYHTLSNYITRTSKFVDLRLAVIQGTKDLYGEGLESAAAASAFDQVGIAAPGSGQQVPTTEEEIIEVNPGEQFLIVYEPEGKSIYRGAAGGENYDVVAEGLGCQRKPSISDDGTAMYFVAADGNIYYVDLTASAATAQPLSSNGAWSNVAISKNGTLLAALTSSEDGKIYVFNLETDQQASFELFNPTYTQGVSTGEVLYADALEWDYSGEYLVYDAFNRVSSLFGDLEYWDVGLLKAWDLNTNDFGDGDIEKIFSDLDDGDNIGNPALSKTNPNIIAFDYLDAREDKFYILGVNLYSGDLNLLIENNAIGYPDFTIDDKILAYTAEEAVGEVVKLIPLNDDKISTTVNAGTRLFDEGQDKWAVFYAQGQRKLPTKEAQTIQFSNLADQSAGAVVNLNAVASSGFGVQYSVISGDAVIQGNTVVVGNTPGLITVQAFQVGGSDFTSASAEQSFCLNPQALSITSDGETVFASNSGLYQWYVNGNPIGGQTTNSQRVVDRNGTYSVKAATADGCLSDFSNEIQLQLQRVLGTEPSELEALSVYPNPAQNEIKISVPKGSRFVSAEIRNTSGKSILSTDKEVINIGHFNAGVYIIKVTTDKGDAYRKVVKQ
ncbi:M4 family metallopeptidase [Arcticibacterium luteifluviistationis]|uniref:Neutral protease n=1 Tax=Arcticibacterium luteifluviistationis TaxID=1784714 RepID=A0A2Z4GDB6_9BACT|nr:M4 family metallopeptidase [Arcticibacterium luteifluviistationis]AWV99107.1 neutral protease [Arcticibacterium luteifluviistationis]